MQEAVVAPALWSCGNDGSQGGEDTACTDVELEQRIQRMSVDSETEDLSVVRHMPQAITWVGTCQPKEDAGFPLANLRHRRQYPVPQAVQGSGELQGVCQTFVVLAHDALVAHLEIDDRVPAGFQDETRADHRKFPGLNFSAVERLHASVPDCFQSRS